MTLDCSPNDPCADREGSLHASSARSSSLACKCSPRRHFPTGVWCAALLSLCCRPRPIESAAATSQSHQAFEALASIALHKSDTSSQQRYTSSQQALPLSLLSVAACLAVLPPTRAAELTDSLCEAEIDICSRPACKCSPRRPLFPTGEPDEEETPLVALRWAHAHGFQLPEDACKLAIGASKLRTLQVR